MFERESILDARAHLRDVISQLQHSDVVGWIAYGRYVEQYGCTDAEVRERMLAGQIKFKKVRGKLLLLAT
ncbi:hypothetical protein SAMN06265221_11128 [Paracoccus laeviglucosivorans]|uniref:Uncharacterized protein n=2 Tax=Paracoccus laeviglucosivorans TaxID=1197861 RepID=A0A521E3H9_9RHOB|nr:hypothetical protein SAMN06265221_11128 [Paracoccus laeviglucosivorans]